MKDCVIARYKEDINWIKQLGNCNLHVYNKFDSGPNPLPNIGRDAQTFIHHIVKHYDNLPEITVFLQGNPFDHCQSDIIRLINDIESVMGDKKYIDLGTQKLIEEKEGSLLSNGQRQSVPLNFCRYYSEILRLRCPQYFEFVTGMNSAIKKEAIQSKPKEFYQKILNIFERDGDKPAWAIERFWGSIFK